MTKKEVVEMLNDIDYRYELKGDADWLMNEILDRLENMPTSSQTEISDEEMWEKANEMGKKTNSCIVTQYFYYGAKWYREQLKKKQ